MMRSMYSGVSGLKNHQTRMDVIGNNISNVNTTGFKSGRVTFSDMLSQTVTGASAPADNRGGTNPKQVGLGSSVAAIDLMFTDGSVQGTGKNTDLALSGNGLFVVKRGTETYYTRNGAFEFDADGNYVQPGNGLFVQGWMAKDGLLTTTGEVGNIQIPSGKSMESQATKVATYVNNLNGDPDGYTISNMLVTYVDGTSEITTNYSPNEKGSIVLTFEHADGTEEKVTLDSTATYDFKTGDVVPGKTLYTSKINSVTATETGTADVTVGMGTAVNKINNSTTYTATGLKSGTYSINGNYTLSGTITLVTAAGTDNVDITLEDGTVVNVPKPSTFDYAVGDTFSAKLPITKIEAAAGAQVTTANGSTATTTAALTVNNADDTYERKTAAADYKIKAVGRTTTPTYNSKEVASVTINTLDGKTLNGLLGQTYNANNTFYPSVVTTVTVYDSLGGSHDIPVLFSKTGENKWNLSLTGGVDSYSYTESDLTETTVTLTSNDLKFTTTGAFDTEHPGTATIALSYGNGAADQEVTLNLNSLTQYIGSSTINADADGHAAGTLASVSIDSSGIITGTYTNGVRQYEAQIAVAQFNNASGLTKTGESLYQQSNNSGEANVHTADDLGVTITPSALEMSNVDIANEFTDMIVTQRGFQGNSKVITVSDEMLETLINMKR